MIAALIGVLLVPLLPYAWIEAQAQIEIPSPGADLWREVRGREPAEAVRTQVQGIDASVLINTEGDRWREYRVSQLVPYSAMVFAGVVALFVLYYLIHGRIRIQSGRSGKLIPRYTAVERWIHWFLATVFLVLMISGLILLYGRWVLIPLLGPEGFSATAVAGKWVHNVTGPLFILAVILAAVAYFKEALFDWKVDLQWFLRAGGYLGGRHPASGKINAGQKAWYWVVVIGGLFISFTGLVLDFPNFEQGRNALGLAYVTHTLAAVFMIAFFVVHLYLASIGMEGSLESMTTGYVDANWAKEQHELWFKEMVQRGKVYFEPADGQGGRSSGEAIRAPHSG